MKFLKVFSRVVLGIFGLVALLYLVAVAVNWNDQPPSAAVRELDELLAAQPPLPDAENGFVYLLGFSAPADQDPREVGIRRQAWLASFYSAAVPGADPLAEPIGFKSASSTALKDFTEKCTEDDRKGCAEIFEKTAGDWRPTEIETLELQRYQALLAHRAWRDVLFHVKAPIPPYADVIHAQRLHLLSMMQLARQGKADEVRAGLDADLAYWRGAQRDSQSLIGKMIGVAGLRHHFFFSNLMLRRLPPDQVLRATPSGWQKEFTDDERSLRLVMAGEFKFAEGFLHSSLADGELADSVAGSIETTLSGQWLHYVAKPLFQEQDTLNGVAERYSRFAAQFAVPMREYAAARAALERQALESPQPVSIYNPIGDYYLRMVDGTAYVNYAYRTAAPEGMRRVTLLLAQLRARGVAAADVHAELGRAELRDPYTLAPFTWDAQRASVSFIGPEEHTWRRNEFFY